MARNAGRKSHWRHDLDVWSTPVMANMIWLIFMIPVVTIPLAFAGLLATMFYWIDDQRTDIFKIFFGTIRGTWRRCYMLFALDLLIGGFLALNLFAFQLMNMGELLTILSHSATLFAIFIFLITNVVAWVLVSTWDAPLKNILSFSLQLVFGQPIWTTLTAVAFYLTFVVSAFMPAVMLVMATGALAAYMACRGIYTIISKYIEREDFKLIDLS